jgi:nicotinamidase-related amidase
MLQIADRLNIPVLVNEQNPKQLGKTVKEVDSALPKNAYRFSTTNFGILDDDETRIHLANLNREQMIVCGLETHVIINQTVHQLLEASYQPHFIQDAISSMHIRDHEIGISKMTQSGAIPSCVAMAMFEFNRKAENLEFKELEQLTLQGKAQLKRKAS